MSEFKHNDKIINLMILIVYISSLLFIKMMRFDEINYFYLSTVTSLVLVVYGFITQKNKVFHEKNKIIAKLKIIILIYCLYVILLTSFLKISALVYSVNVITPLLTFAVLISIIDNIPLLNKIEKVITYIFLLVTIMSIILYLFGISKIDLTFNNGLEITTTAHYLERYGESRVSWLMSHKSRYALFCLIGLASVFNTKEICKKVKISTIILLYINLYLTSSITSLFVGILIAIIRFRKNIKDLLFKNKLSKLIIFIVTLGITVGGIIIVSFSRDILTLGSRTYIWISGLKQIFNHWLGIIAMDNEFLLSSPNLSFRFSNGHNVFINEMIERGVIGGILFIVILVLMMYLYYRTNNCYYIWVNICFIIGMMMDYTLSQEITYIYWYINAIWCAKSLLVSFNNKQNLKS